MSILTKSQIRSLKGFVSINKLNTTASPEAAYVFSRFSDALDTIDALEKERDIAQETIDSCFEILEDTGFSTVDPDGCGLPGIVCDLARALNTLSGGLK